MGSKHRRKSTASHDLRVYKMHPSGQGYVCLYCGEPAVGKDHYPPIYALDHVVPDVKFVWVRSCDGCNFLAGRVIDQTLEARICRVRASRGKQGRYKGNPV